MPPRVAAKKPLLTDLMVKKRMFLQGVQRLEGARLEKCHVFRRIHLQAVKLQGGEGAEAEQHLPLQAAVHGPHCETFP